MRASQDFLRVGATVTFVGFIILLLGIVLTILQHPASSQMGGLIMIGPIPIAFGSSPEITTNMLGLGLIVSILYLFLWKTKR
ncbi:TIGR00304 family membrane protein [Methanosarcina sp.]|uniref:TIGR00304 family membrane protein n=1 Tax=Methanosarcina sp. TaxID=2213 RepID=UPI003C791DFE